MRQTPYNFTAKPTPPAAETTTATEPVVQKQSFQQSVVRSLKDEISRPASKPTATTENAPKTEAETQTPPTEPATGNPQPTTEQKGTANLGPEVEKFKQGLQKDIDNAIADPKRAGKNVLKFINMARFILYPWLYKRAIFEGPELTAYDAVLQKTATAIREGKEPVFDAFEKKVKEKADFYDEQKKGIMWTAEEIDQINEVAYLKLAEITFLRWLMSNEWAIVIIYIESKRFVPLFAYRMGFGKFDMGAL